MAFPAQRGSEKVSRPCRDGQIASSELLGRRVRRQLILASDPVVRIIAIGYRISRPPPRCVEQLVRGVRNAPTAAGGLFSGESQRGTLSLFFLLFSSGLSLHVVFKADS